jgi:transcriptional regulator with XRE-family HTH domain
MSANAARHLHPILRARAARASARSKRSIRKRAAERCGLHRTYYSGIERGVRNVSLVNIEKVAKGLRTPISGELVLNSQFQLIKSNRQEPGRPQKKGRTTNSPLRRKFLNGSDSLSRGLVAV